MENSMCHPGWDLSFLLPLPTDQPIKFFFSRLVINIFTIIYFSIIFCCWCQCHLFLYFFFASVLCSCFSFASLLFHVCAFCFFAFVLSCFRVIVLSCFFAFVLLCFFVFAI